MSKINNTVEQFEAMRVAAEEEAQAIMNARNAPKRTAAEGERRRGMQDDLRNFKRKKIADLQQKRKHKNDSFEAKNIWKQAIEDLKDIDNAIRGGANNLQDLKLALKHNVSIVMEIDNELEEAQKKFEEEREDPDLVFKEMNKYVKMVIKGINPSVILCGAPGVGKTYNVKKQLREAGFHEGHNLLTIKGKCTPRVLYLSLMEYKEKGKIVLIDDADGLVGPGAPEDSINILKAALDSTSDDEGRIISYGVRGPLKDDEGTPIAKRFYYNGGIIVITNYQAGSLDTALKGSPFVQDIKFSTEDLLKIVKKLLPAIDPEHLSAKSKIKAYDYLVELAHSGEDMEISIRTFEIFANIFEQRTVAEKEAQSIMDLRDANRNVSSEEIEEIDKENIWTRIFKIVPWLVFLFILFFLSFLPQFVLILLLLFVIIIFFKR